ncbi:hypothetical protein [Parvularcula maris]|uniref:Uncharacterized protein n=1 Tax=Parvularcula maris TaxID=2965077 RepID=A0A9X2LBH6_9PROT|nr:hypothetical protein [Parvularcula maris]MCQ8186429.1 hypothetical protein [Parvularcula maris]
MEISDWLNAAAILASGLGIYVGIRGVRQQIQTETSIRYSEKMIAVIDRHRPKDLSAYVDRPFEEYPDPSKLQEYMEYYYDVIFHEFQLREMGSVNDVIWKTWRQGLRR